MMKKITAVLLAVILMTTLCSCGMTRKIAKVIANEIIEHREEKGGKQNTNSSAPKKGTAEYAVWEEIPEPKSPAQAVNAAEETGNTIAQLLSEMGSYRVIEKKSDRWVMEVTAPDMRKVFAHAQEKLDARGDLPIEEYDAALEQMLDDICNELRSGKVEYVFVRANMFSDDVDRLPRPYELQPRNYYGGISNADANRLVKNPSQL